MDSFDNEESSSTAYEVQDMSAPCVSGFAARLVLQIIESPLLGYFVKRKTLRDSGFLDFHDRVSITFESLRFPLHFPLPDVAQAPPSFEELAAFFEPVWKVSSVRARPKRSTVSDYYAAYKSGQVTPLHVCVALLNLVDSSNTGNPSLNAVTSVNTAAVLRSAQESSDRWRAGRPISLLDGVPLFVKDMITVRDALNGTMAGLGPLVHSPPPPDAFDADVVAALRSAGMIVVGKTHTAEVGMGVRGYTESLGQSRNPWDLNRVSGGSSSGSAAAVAAGLCPISLGSDGGGSVRIPAVCCGVLGLKPTFARVSVRGRLFQTDAPDTDPPSTLSFGPLAGCVDDLALAYLALAARAPHGPLGGQQPFPGGLREKLPAALDGGVAGLRVGVFAPWAESAPATAQVHYRRALGALTAAGASVRAVGVPRLEDMRCAHAVAISGKTYSVLRDNGITQAEKWGRVGIDTRIKMAMAEQFGTDGYRERADCMRAQAVKEIVPRIFSQVDVLVTPAMADETPRVPTDLSTGLIDAATDSRLMRFMYFANFTGLPAVTVPVGVGNGLPYSVQVIGGPWKEVLLLQVAKCLENRLGLRTTPPAMSFDVLAAAAEESSRAG